MAKPAQLDEQTELEREAARCGIDKLRENTRKLEKKTYASASIYGKSSIEELMPALVERINKTRHYAIEKGKSGPLFKELHQYLSDIDTESTALITLKIIFDNVFSYKEDSKKVVTVADAIGSAVEAECQMRFYERTDPKILDRIKRNYWHNSAGTQQKLRVTRLMMNRREIEWQRWSAVIRVKLGGWLLNCVLQESGWFERDMRQEGGKVRQVYLVPTAEFLLMKDALMKNAELFAPLAWPMLIEPNDWSNDRCGGYLLNEVRRGHHMVRSPGQGSPDGGSIQGEQPIQFLNKLQKVAYCLNPFVVKVAEALMEQRIPVGKFVPVYDIPLPPKPHDIADNEEARHAYRRAAAEVMNRNAQIVRRSCRTRSTMELVKRFKGRKRFFIPWSFDYRGRVYPIPAFLTPQDTDFGKSLIRFADEAPMTRKAKIWLAFQVATTYGFDKSTMEERQAWVWGNLPLITRVAMDPLGNRADWEAADEPWQFLAACKEFHSCVLAKTRVTTGLPVAVDATCSGLQILAGLARDKSTATLVNVFPGEKPNDAYKAVAEEAKKLLPEKLAALMDRKTTKRTVMTIPYNAKEYSNRQYIREALKEKQAEVEYEDVDRITKAVRHSMHKIVPGPMAVMDWINDQVKEALKQGRTKLQWVTPSGFVVYQRLMKPNVIRVRLQLLGSADIKNSSCDLEVADGETTTVDKNRHKAATAPNLIHSLDASLLHLAFLTFPHPFTVIHDSVLCRATDMAVLNQTVRDVYAEIFSKHDYLTEFAAQIEAVDPPPIIGDFDPEAVLNSTYFFC
jgi:DNA-directed RNA polymerase